MKSIALVKLSAIGDTILTVPLIRCLQRNFPGVKITWIIGKGAYSLLQGLEGVEFIVINKPKSIGDYFRFYQQLKSRRFDVLLCLQRSLRANLMYPLIKATRKIGFDSTRGREGHSWVTKEKISFEKNHYVDCYLQFAQALGAKDLRVEWDIPIDEAAINWGNEGMKQHPGKWIAMHPSTSQADKNWPIDLNVALIEKLLTATDYQIVLTGGNGENDLAQLISDKINSPRVTFLSGKTGINLKQLAALYTHMHCVIAPDTGPLHLANALDVAVVGLYAASDPREAGAYNYSDFLINHYPDAVKLLGQDIDKIRFGRKMRDARVMRLITVDEVFAKTLDILRHNR